MSGKVHTRERAHPTAGKYLQIAAILTVVTAIEVAVYYIHALRPALLAILLVLSALKFSLVAMFYMHLRFDSRLFSGLFIFPLVIMAAILVALLAVFRILG
jgi:cytochrome c oxidase subunit 4